VAEEVESWVEKRNIHTGVQQKSGTWPFLTSDKQITYDGRIDENRTPQITRLHLLVSPTTVIVVPDSIRANVPVA
jgi:hypothetical protein